MAQTLASGVVIPAPGDRISAAGVQEIRTLGASVNTGLTLTRAQAAQTDLQSRARDAELADQVAGMEGMTYTGSWEAGRVYRINDVVTHGGDSWARLTGGSAGEPGVSAADWGLVAQKGDGGGFGDLSETVVPGLYDTVDTVLTLAQVDGLVAALAAKAALTHPALYDSGWRDITSLVPVPVASGKLYLARTGSSVWLDFDDLLVRDVPSTSWHSWGPTIPVGFRPARNWSYVPLAPTWSNRSTANQAVNSSQTLGPVRLASGGHLVIYGALNGTNQVTPIRGLTSWPTREAPPINPPGSPA